MGDRGQVLIKDEGVYLYTHWGASGLVDTVKNALAHKERWDDPEYLARIIFCEMVGEADALAGSTGFGIGTEKHEDVWRVVIVNCADHKVIVEDNNKAVFSGSFEEFIAEFQLHKIENLLSKGRATGFPE